MAIAYPMKNNRAQTSKHFSQCETAPFPRFVYSYGPFALVLEEEWRAAIKAAPHAVFLKMRAMRYDCVVILRIGTSSLPKVR